MFSSPSRVSFTHGRLGTAATVHLVHLSPAELLFSSVDNLWTTTPLSTQYLTSTTHAHMLTPLGMAPSSTFRLHDLPAELRNRVYVEVVTDDGPRRVELSTARSRLPSLALAMVSRQVYNETIKLYQEALRGFWSTHSLDISLDFLTGSKSDWHRRQREAILVVTNLHLQPVYDLFISLAVDMAVMATKSAEIHVRCTGKAGVASEVKLGPAVHYDSSSLTAAHFNASRAIFEQQMPQWFDWLVKRTRLEEERFRMRLEANEGDPGGVEGLDVEECLRSVSQLFRGFTR